MMTFKYRYIMYPFDVFVVWRQVYGVYISPPSEDDFRAAEALKRNMSKRTGNGNDHRQSTGDQSDVHNCGSVLAEYPTPMATRMTKESRNARYKRDEHNEITSSERSVPTNQRPSSRHVTRTMSEGRRGGYGRPQSSQDTSQQSVMPVNSGRRQSDEGSEQAMKRMSRNDAELRIENEIVEAMRRDEELRYRYYLNNMHQ